MTKSIIRDKTQALFSGGFFHIFGANVINKIVAFATNIVIVWFLTKDDYGVFSYANNIYSFMALITGFGLLTGMFQLCSERRSQVEKNAVLWYSFTRGVLIDSVLAFALFVLGLLLVLPIEKAGTYLTMLGPLLVLDYLFQFASVALRSKRDNKRFASLQTINTVLYFAFGCLGAFLFGIAGTIIGRYAAYVASLGVAVAYIRLAGFGFSAKPELGAVLKRDLWSYSIPTQLSSAVNQMTFLLDVFLVGFFIADASSVASYKVATMLPEGLLFVPASLILFAMPYFIEHNFDRRWFSRNMKVFLFAGGGIYAVITMMLIALAPSIIELLWGSDYLDATIAFRALSICFFFSAIRTSCTNMLCAVRAVKSNLAVSMVSLVANVVLCLLLIPRFGINGAAFAPLIVSVIAAVAALALLIRRVRMIAEGIE